MGSGIAQIAACAGLQVFLCDVHHKILDKGIERISKSLEKLVAKQKVSNAEAESALGRIQTSAKLHDLHEADFVLEAVSENEELKKNIFRQLDKITPPHAILASNTSSISITRLAASTQRPECVVGMHFMNPVPIMGLVELVSGIQTSDSTFSSTRLLAERLDKVVAVAADRPGFIINRLLVPMINEAFFALMEGVGSAEDIDMGMKLGTNQPMGPLALGDFIGLDTCLSIMHVLQSGLGEDKYRPCPLMVQYVDAGWLGRKSGRGVYAYGNI